MSFLFYLRDDCLVSNREYSMDNLIGKRIGVYDLDGCVVDSSARLKKYVDTDALAAGDYTKYTHSFYAYGQTSEGDVPISKGIMLVQALATMYQVDALVALTSRGEVGREATEAWLQRNLPWATGGDLLVMHKERHFGREEYRGQSRWGYPAVLVGERDVRREGDVWFVDVLDKDELFSPSKYKVRAMESLMKWCDVAFAVDDHPEIIEAFDGFPFDSFRVVWSGVDCLTPAGDPRSGTVAK